MSQALMLMLLTIVDYLHEQKRDVSRRLYGIHRWLHTWTAESTSVF